MISNSFDLGFIKENNRKSTINYFQKQNKMYPANRRRISGRRFFYFGGREATTGNTSAVRRLNKMQTDHERFIPRIPCVLHLSIKLLWYAMNKEQPKWATSFFEVLSFWYCLFTFCLSIFLFSHLFLCFSSLGDRWLSIWRLRQFQHPRLSLGTRQPHSNAGKKANQLLHSQPRLCSRESNHWKHGGQRV